MPRVPRRAALLGLTLGFGPRRELVLNTGLSLGFGLDRDLGPGPVLDARLDARLAASLPRVDLRAAAPLPRESRLFLRAFFILVRCVKVQLLPWLYQFV